MCQIKGVGWGANDSLSDNLLEGHPQVSLDNTPEGETDSGITSSSFRHAQVCRFYSAQ